MYEQEQNAAFIEDIKFSLHSLLLIVFYTIEILFIICSWVSYHRYN